MAALLSPKSRLKFIMLSNEKFALERRAYYDSIGLVVDERNGEFAHCPLPERYGDKGYYLLHGDHQHQGLLQSKDTGECCFFSGDAKKWLLACDPLPNNYFELWDIYDQFSILRIEKLHEEKTDEGKSVNAVKGGVKAIKKLHEEKDENGKSVFAVKGARKVHSTKDELGRSVTAVKAGRATHKKKDKLGRSIQGVKNGERLNKEKDEQGRSLNQTKATKKAALNRQRGVQLVRINDKEVFIFESIKIASEMLKLCHQNINAVCRGKRKTVGGYVAEYWNG